MPHQPSPLSSLFNAKSDEEPPSAWPEDARGASMDHAAVMSVDDWRDTAGQAARLGVAEILGAGLRHQAAAFLAEMAEERIVRVIAAP